MTSNLFSQLNRIPLVSVMCLTLAISTFAIPAHGEDSNLSLEQLAQKIAAAERLLENVHVSSHLWVEARSEQTREWSPTGVEISLDTWLDGLPGSKARLDIHEEILEWEDGPAAFSRDSMSVSYNGQTSRLVHHAAGTLDKQNDIRRAEIVPEPHKMLSAPMYRAASGSLFALNYVLADEATSLSNALTNGVKDMIRVDQVEYNGYSTIRIVGGDINGTHIAYWLAPDRGYAIVGYRSVSTSDKSDFRSETRDTVKSLQQVAPGIWYPTEAYREYLGDWPEGIANTRFHYVAHAVEANLNAVNDDTYRADLPVGYFVRDHVAGFQYQVGRSPDLLEADLDGMLDVIHSMQPTP